MTDVIGRQSRVVVTDLLADQRTALRLGLRVVPSGHHANLPNQAVSTWAWGPVGRAAPIGWLAMLEATLAYCVSRKSIMKSIKTGSLQAVYVRTGRRKGLRIEPPTPEQTLFQP